MTLHFILFYLVQMGLPLDVSPPPPPSPHCVHVN